MTPEQILEKRKEIITEAQSWIGTPFVLNQCVKQGGVDCARLIHAVMYNCGLVPADMTEKMIEIFGPDWSSHTNDPKYEKYIFRMIRHSKKILEGFTNHALHPLPGTIAVVKTYQGRVADHGGIVVAWPRIIHAVPERVAETKVTDHWLWGFKKVEIYDPLGTTE